MKKKKIIRAASSVLALLLVLVLLTYITTPFEKNSFFDNTSDFGKQIALTFDDGPG